MNKEWITFHLEEALEQLQETISNLKSDKDYSYGDYVVEISHLYHHINTAWNSREASPNEVANHTDADYDKWQRMPEFEDLLIGTLTEDA